MNSSLYTCKVMHHRLEPIRHQFSYNLFMFYLDIDEIDVIADRLRFLSRNRFNLFNFRDRDHMHTPAQTLRDTISSYLRAKGLHQKLGPVRLLTHLNTLGYTFNPVSFYFVFSVNLDPICAIAEINNTFGEMKLFYLDPDTFDGQAFSTRRTKYFYVSPFIDMDTDFHFLLTPPGERLNIRIDGLQNGRRFFISTLTGVTTPITDARLFWYSIRFPAITLRVIGAIHWQALKLWWRGLPYHKKSDQQELQREVYRGTYHSSR